MSAFGNPRTGAGSRGRGAANAGGVGGAGGGTQPSAALDRFEQRLINEFHQATGLSFTLDEIRQPDFIKTLVQRVCLEMQILTENDVMQVARVMDIPITLEESPGLFQQQMELIAWVKVGSSLFADIAREFDLEPPSGNRSDLIFTMTDMYRANPKRVHRAMDMIAKLFERTRTIMAKIEEEGMESELARKAVQESDAKIAALEAEKQALTDLAERERQQAEQVRSHNHGLVRDTKSIQMKRDKLEAEIQECLKRDKEIREELDKKAEECRVIKEAIATKQRYIIDDPQAMRDSLHNLHSQMEAAKSRLDAVTQKRQDIVSNIQGYDEFISDVNNLVSRLSELHDQRNQLTHIVSECTAKEAQLARITEEKASFASECASLQETVARAEDLLTRLQEELGNQKSSNAATAKEAADEYSALQDQVEAKRAQAEALTREAAQLTEQILTLRAQYAQDMHRVYAEYDAFREVLDLTVDEVGKVFVEDSAPGGLFAPSVEPDDMVGVE